MNFAAHADPWLTDVMQRPAFRVETNTAARDTPGTAQLAEHIAGHRGSFYFAKTPTDRVGDVGALSTLGFSVVDTNVTFELVREPAVHVRDDVDVGELAGGDEQAVLDIAGSAFRYSRFHLDPKIGDRVAHDVKREWIRNYVLKRRGDALLVAKLDGQVRGFLAALVVGGKAVIDLVAVAADASTSGIGTALAVAFAKRYRGVPRVVGTQIANVPSIRLYTKLGFTLASSAYVLHLHTEK